MTKLTKKNLHPESKHVTYIDPQGVEYLIKTTLLESQDRVMLGYNPFAEIKVQIRDTQKSGARRLSSLDLGIK